QHVVLGAGKGRELGEREADGAEPPVLSLREPCRERGVVAAAAREEVADPVRKVAFVGRRERGRETEATIVAHVTSFPNRAPRKPRVTGARHGYPGTHDHRRTDTPRTGPRVRYRAPVGARPRARGARRDPVGRG